MLRCHLDFLTQVTFGSVPISFNFSDSKTSQQHTDVSMTRVSGRHL